MHLGSILQAESRRNYAVHLDSSKYHSCNGQEEENQEVLAEETDSILMFLSEMKRKEEHKKGIATESCKRGHRCYEFYL